MFTLVFSLIFGVSALTAGADDTKPVAAEFEVFHTQLEHIFRPHRPPYGLPGGEPLTEEALERLFEDSAKLKMLEDFEQDFRSFLDKKARCGEAADPVIGKEWLILAQVEVDLYSLKPDGNLLEKAQGAAEMALKCDANNQPARRLVRDLRGAAR